MPSEANIQANRRNAQSSTGPQTPEGKARSSQNALKHGIRAQAILDIQFEVLDEDPADFAALLQALVDDLRPVGPIEEMCVETIAITTWRQLRLIRAETGHIAVRQKNIIIAHDNPAGRALYALPSLDTLLSLTRYETHLDRQINRAFSQLITLQRDRQLKEDRQASDDHAETEAILRTIILELAQQPTNEQSHLPAGLPATPMHRGAEGHPSQPSTSPFSSPPQPPSSERTQSPANRPDAAALAPRPGSPTPIPQP
ncbi:MAG: hypothetical protein HY675_11255, partial [Chloroflexi bacterium]|nr:hypothetical protein [Chloroflexota bacterium]